MEHAYFKCPKKGDVLTIRFDEFEDINVNNLAALEDKAKGRYVKLVVKKEGVIVCQTIVNFELAKQNILDEMKQLMINDWEDLKRINEVMEL